MAGQLDAFFRQQFLVDGIQLNVNIVVVRNGGWRRIDADNCDLCDENDVHDDDCMNC